MDGFTLVDGAVLAVIIISAVLAYARGLMREMLSIAGWVAAAIAAFAFAPAVDPLMREIPVLRDILGTNCELGLLAGFAAVFAVALIIVSFFTPLLAGVVHNSALGPIDQGLGLLFGVARGVLLVIIALVVYDQVLGAGGVAMVDDSRSRAVLDSTQKRLTEDAPAALSWVVGRYELLTQNCAQPAT
ncbi:CvpA family protein [Amaricoccus solimangrovi]|uniref:CvpA family protein n=1 Tax=Amaricoccus solimangrovi TaxID=2589815 RepID=A0A501WQV6_9RHOB|nr:CvpA family protein [Amaricoccus solimangrovi]TPE50750.1 CvpA family protein [Amaricoccus solimangrovi]